MEAFVFPSEQALEVALTSGLVPVEVQGAPAQVGVGGDGTGQVAPSVPLGARHRRAGRGVLPHRRAADPAA